MSFLRLPPFPGHRAQAVVQPGGMREDLVALCAAVREERVGGAFWLPPVMVPEGRDIVLAPCCRAQAKMLAAMALRDGVAGRCVMLGPWRGPVARLAGPVNPWQMVEGAVQVWAGAGHDLALVATLCGVPTRVLGDGMWARLGGQGRDPFTGEAMSLMQVARMLGVWRRGIERNRGIDGVLGVARWKRATMAPMLWDGGGAVAFDARGGQRLVGWRARMGRDAPLALEVEDGFIRSVGLGAACVPPLSVVVDAVPHFDPAGGGDLAAILARGGMDDALLARARALRARIVAGGIGKYGVGGGAMRRDMRRSILVCGQVEDDRAMLLGGAGVSNLALLQRARSMEPEAQIIWRPHPDVEAGLRRGAIDAAGLADRVERKAPLADLLAQVDAVHVVCSLAGFEALLRRVPVVTHGVPFYAGWGLTRDIGPVPVRGRLGLDELVAGALLLYPRYVDPVTLLPCTAEVVVGRIESGLAGVRSGWGWLVGVRRVLGWVKKVKAGGVSAPCTPGTSTDEAAVAHDHSATGSPPEAFIMISLHAGFQSLRRRKSALPPNPWRTVDIPGSARV